MPQKPCEPYMLEGLKENKMVQQYWYDDAANREDLLDIITNTSPRETQLFSGLQRSKAESIKPGDIAGVRGHVVMIDKVGTDPFGLKKISSVAQCSTISPANFDFTVTQSSPSKNGIGINKYIIKDYLAEQGSTGKMTVLFTEMAKNACKAYFQNAAIKPASADWGIIRHNGKPECLAPRIQLANQSCVSQCQL